MILTYEELEESIPNIIYGLTKPAMNKVGFSDYPYYRHNFSLIFYLSLWISNSNSHHN